MTGWIGDAASVGAPAKINLCLRVVGRRADGYHLLDGIVVPIDLFDYVMVQVTPSTASQVSLRCEPPHAAPSGADNLAARAAECFLRHSGAAARVAITLIKQIPAGAGLGGGSSDAAAVLRVLNALRRNAVASSDLMAWALELGADVPFFLFGCPARVSGIGEVLEPWADMIVEPLVVAFPGTGLSTPAVYAKYDDLLTMSDPPSTIRGLTSGPEPPHSYWRNDLEAAACLVQPELGVLKGRLRSLGAESVMMTGSGSAVFGQWRRWDDARAAAEQLRATGVWARVARMLERIPAVELVS